MVKQRNNLPIWRDANRLLVLMEEAVRSFSRYHKYSVGADWRQQVSYFRRWFHHASVQVHKGYQWLDYPPLPISDQNKRRMQRRIDPTINSPSPDTAACHRDNKHPIRVIK